MAQAAQHLQEGTDRTSPAEIVAYVHDPAATPGLDQLTSVTQGTTTSFSYNPDGEVTARGADSLTWDGRGRLTGGTFGGTSLSYGFDASGRRRSRTGGGATTRYLFAGSGGAALFETDSNGVIQLTGIEGPAGDLAHYAGPPTTSSSATFLYYNGHGDLAATADLSGSRTAAYTYDPFGAPRQAQPANAAVERWTGRWDKKLDTVNSLVEMGARPIGAFLFLWVLSRTDRRPAAVARFLSALAPGIGLILLSAVPRSPSLTQLLAGAGVALIGAHWLLFQENWIRFNQAWSGSIMRWHRSYSHSRLVVLLVGTVTLVMGTVAAVQAFSK